MLRVNRVTRQKRREAAGRRGRLGAAVWGERALAPAVAVGGAGQPEEGLPGCDPSPADRFCGPGTPPVPWSRAPCS